MKLAMQVIEFDFFTARVFEFEVRDPGTPLHVCVDYEMPKTLLHRPSSLPPAEPTQVSKLYVLIDPDGEVRRRRYFAVPEHAVIETEQEVLRFMGVWTNPNDGARVAVFEVSRHERGCYSNSERLCSCGLTERDAASAKPQTGKVLELLP